MRYRFYCPCCCNLPSDVAPASPAGRVSIALAALLTKPLIKPVISRFGYRTVLIWNTRLIGSLIMLLSLPTADTPQWLLIPMLFTIGICNSLQYSAMNTLTLAGPAIRPGRQRQQPDDGQPTTRRHPRHRLRRPAVKCIAPPSPQAANLPKPSTAHFGPSAALPSCPAGCLPVCTPKTANT